MKRILSASAALVLASTAWAADPAPGDLAYGDYGELDAALTDTAGDAANGRVVVSSKSMGNCIACHAVTDLEEFPFHGEVGPTLDGVGSRWSEAELRGLVADAKRTFEGTMMPSFYKNDGYIRPGEGYTGKAPEGALSTILSAQDIEDVVAYLMTLQES